jgi:hypothetical protein
VKKFEANYGVFYDENRHTAIRVGEDKANVFFIPFATDGLDVHKLSHDRFARQFTSIPDYTPKRAAEKYLFTGDGVKIQISLEARAHLERMAGKLYDRSKDQVPEDFKVEIPSSALQPTQESITMATSKKTPAKRPVAKKTAAKAEAGTRGRKPAIADTAKIKLLVKENPKRGTAAERFSLYKNGMTVGDALEAGMKRADINWDVGQGFIEVK